jgi:winged helix DNA-binding protein
LEIPLLRLYNQQLTSPSFEKPADVVSWFGAMQSQDFAAAKWAIAQRLKNQTDISIEQAFNNGDILRTHIMRPTWHFVTPKDIRWLLALTSPRVHRFNGYYHRRSGLDKSVFQKSNAIIQKTLQGGKQLTCDELNTHLKRHHIPTQDLGLSFIIMQAELDGIVCSGLRRGKQFTYMLLEERVPKHKEITRDAALYELTKRYFQSHGPAQIKDFVWWSGLTVEDTRSGIDLNPKLHKETINDKTYWFFPPGHEIKSKNDNAFLIPGFDEYFIAYTDRSDILEKKYAKELNQGGGMINGVVVIHGKMVGGWKRKFIKKSVVVTIRLFEKITDEQQNEIKKQAERYGTFANMPIITEFL